jgi:outer membrane protein assembly factor BamB
MALSELAFSGEPAAPTWPQFHGPRRDNRSDETGLLKKWPSGGPELLWTAKGIGQGYSTVAIAGGLVYTTGNIGSDTVVTALDLDGKARWTARNGPACRRSYPGTRGTPTIDDGRLYHENADGDVACLDAQTGKPVWSLNILKKFKGRNITWGLAESLLIDGNKVICTPGGEDAGIVALDKSTGKTVWTCTGTIDKPGYCSPIVFDYKGIRQIVTLMARSVVGVNAETGKLLWRVKHVAYADETITTPIFRDGCILVATLTQGARLFRLNVEVNQVSAEQVWQNRVMDNQHGGVLFLNGHVYGDGLSKTRGPWVCLEFKTGKQVCGASGIGRCSLTYADGMFYTLNHGRTVALVRARPEAYEAVSRFSIPEGGKGPTWAHPVVCGGRLYIRHGDFLYCYDVKEQ